MSMLRTGPRTGGILDKGLSKGKSEINLATFALLFSEIVQYCQNRINNVQELEQKLSEFGYFVGSKLIDVIVLREKGYKRETKHLGMLMFIKTNVWKSLFGKEADRLERSNDNKCTYYIIEKDPLVNTFISVPKDKGINLSPFKFKGSLNCAAFTAGIVEAMLNLANFPAKVVVHWHSGTTYEIKFDEIVIERETRTESR